MRITFTIPGRPRGKARARASARIVGGWADQRAVISMRADEDTAALEADIARLYRIACGGRRITAGPVRLNILAVVPYGPNTFPRALQRAIEECRVWHIGKPDLDNIEKLICDALNGHAYRDDGQIAVVTKGKRYGSPGRVEVTVEHIAQQPDERTPGQVALEKRVAREGWDAVLAGEDAQAIASKARKRRR